MNRLISSILGLLVLAACGSEGPPPTPTPKSLFPLSKGNRWEFRVTEIGKPISTKVQTVTATTSVEGQPAFVLTTENEGKRTVSIQRLDGDRLLRLSEQVFVGGVLVERVRYNPPALRIDTQLTQLGATYANHHNEEQLDPLTGVVRSTLPKTETFTVEAVDEAVTVPKGTIICARIKKVSSTGAAKTYWFARGIGKVKEVGGQTEELVKVDVTLPGAD